MDDSTLGTFEAYWTRVLRLGGEDGAAVLRYLQDLGATWPPSNTFVIDRLEDWIGQAEEEALREHGLRETPAEWTEFRARALAELREAVRRG
jgi:hypothetical protein